MPNGSAQPAARLIMFPGMGTNAPFLEYHKRAFPTLETPPWIPCKPEEPLEHYARRLLDTLDTTPPFYLAGVSFGGMVALEMALHCRPEAVLLIGSARSGKQVPRHIRGLARLGRHLPLAAVAAFTPRPLVRLHLALREGLNREHLAILKRATEGFDRTLFRWIGDAIARWELTAEPQAPVYQIHGDRDWLLKPPPPGPGIEFISGARHMINLTHADHVNAFIRRHAPDVPTTATRTHPAPQRNPVTRSRT